MEYKYTTKDGYKLYSFNNIDDFNEWFKKFPEYIRIYDKSIK